MKQEEKIEVMLEEIFKSLEDISKKVGSGGGGGGEDLAELKQRFDTLITKLGNVTTPITGRGLTSLDQKLNVLIERSAYHQPSDPGEVKHHHYLWFFPDMKSWLGMVQSSRIAWVLGVSLAISIGFNYFIGKDYSKYQESDLKYQYIKLSGNLDYIHDLDSVWRIDSLREARIKYVMEEEAILQAEVQNHRKKMELRRQLDSLEQNALE